MVPDSTLAQGLDARVDALEKSVAAINQSITAIKSVGDVYHGYVDGKGDGILMANGVTSKFKNQILMPQGKSLKGVTIITSAWGPVDSLYPVSGSGSYTLSSEK